MKEHSTAAQLPLVAWEKAVLSRKTLPPMTTIAAELVEGPATARKLAAKLTREVPLDCMVAHYEPLSEALTEHDETWQLEAQQLISLGGQAGQNRLYDALLRCLPGVEGPRWTMPEAAEKIKEVESSALSKLLGSRGRLRCSALSELLANMARGCENIDEDFTDSAFLIQAS